MPSKSLSLLCVVALAHAGYIDECSQYPDCQSCLNIQDDNAPGGLTTRPNCGWCHFNIQYEDGSTGARCADVRDKPFKCRDLFDTYQCTKGFECDASGTGQCGPAKGGDGYQNITSCQQYYPNGCKAQSQFKCNTTSYKCIPCGPSETGCETSDECGKNCQHPPTPKPTPSPPPTPTPKPTPPKPTPPPPPPLPANSFRCNHTSGECKQCTDPFKQTGCDKASTACANCRAPPKSGYYSCNETSLQCVQDPRSQQSQTECQGLCTNSTPPSIRNTVFRGIEAHAGFAQGEWDYKFDSANTVQVRNPAGDVDTGAVSQVNGVLVITMGRGAMSGQKMKAIQPLLNNGDETDTLAFGFGGPSAEAPDNIKVAMDGQSGRRVHVLSKCRTTTGACDFGPAFNAAPAPPAAPAVATERRLGAGANAVDGCNAYTSCNTCIGATAGGVKCGWCMGGFVKYNDTTLPTTAQCAGYKNGEPFAFTCAPEFRTAGCDGYKCLFTASPPKCVEDPEGEAPDMATCMNGTQSTAPCKAAQMVRCNPTSKQCEPCAAGSSADCKYTQAQCDAVCAVPHAKCNYNTSKCEPCAFGLDPNCTMTMGSCQAPGVCEGNTFGLCNVTTGKCDKCDPNQQKGCVAKCQDTCTKKPTPPPTPKPHPPSPKPTPKPTPPPKPTFFSCDWTAQPPKCKEDPSATTTQQECSTQCQTATFAKCNTTTYKCDSCTQGSDPDCKLTKAVCDAGCKKPDHNTTTVYRGNEISSNFARGEWDFTFYPDNKLGIGYLDGKGGVFKWEGTLGGHFAVGAGPSQSIMLTLTEVPAAGAPFAAKVGDQLSGIYEDKAGYYQVTDFKYLAFSMPGGTTPADMDAGMTGNMEFVLVKCHETGKNCDFTGAEVPE